jgi:hypothetical protein
VNDAIRLGVFEDAALDVLAGIVFWIAVTLLASALPLVMPRGSIISTSMAPLVVVMTLGGPTAAGWVALVGTTDLRELRREIPWYGTLANHAGLALPAMAGGLLANYLAAATTAPFVNFLSTAGAATLFLVLNVVIAALTLSMRTGQSVAEVVRGDAPTFVGTFVALVPLAWLMSQVYVLPGVGWWAILLVILPVYLIRLALGRYIEMREMFTQTVASLAQAVDARDKFTSGHSVRVKQISVDIGRVMRVSESELEALEWGGLLHDIGKIGVPDDVLNKPDKLTKEERAIMNAHPVIGANIIAPVTKLAPELPIIRHHHEWYNGSGYPDRLIGDEIPKLARILHVADAFEAMTAARPYRMKPLTAEQALAELRKFAGIQFDPTIVDAFTKTHWAAGVNDPGRAMEPRAPVPLLAQAAGRMTAASVAAGAGQSASGGAARPTGPSAPPRPTGVSGPTALGGTGTSAIAGSSSDPGTPRATAP